MPLVNASLNRIALVLSLFVVLAMPIAACADASATASAPVQILKCSVNQNRAFVDPYRAVSIAFVDRRNAPADEVRFAIAYAGHAAILQDRGVFSKDVTIEHAFHGFWDVLFTGTRPGSCVVESAHFRDGTSWAQSQTIEGAVSPT